MGFPKGMGEGLVNRGTFCGRLLPRQSLWTFHCFADSLTRGGTIHQFTLELSFRDILKSPWFSFFIENDVSCIVSFPIYTHFSSRIPSCFPFLVLNSVSFPISRIESPHFQKLVSPTPILDWNLEGYEQPTVPSPRPNGGKST